MASKKASSASPVSAWMARASAGEVRGPVATMTLSHAAGGRPAISSREISIEGCASSARVTSAAKPSRSTASAPPAGSLLASAARHDQRGGAAHLLVQQPDGVGLPFVGAEGVRADQLGEGAGLMRLGLAVRAASRAARPARRLARAARPPRCPPSRRRSREPRLPWLTLGPLWRYPSSQPKQA